MMVGSRGWCRLVVLGMAFGLCGTVLTGCAGIASTPSSDTGEMHSHTAQIVKENFDKAKALRTKGDFNGAAKLLSQILLADPDAPDILGEYGKALTEQGRTADAIPYLHRAIMLNGSDWTVYSALGVALDGNRQSEEAKSAYEHALKLQPSEKVILNNYALSRLLAGDANGALALIKQAAEGTNDPKILRNLAMTQSLTGIPQRLPQSAGVKGPSATAPMPEGALSPTIQSPKSLPAQSSSMPSSTSAPAAILPQPAPAPESKAASSANAAPVETKVLAPSVKAKKGKSEPQRPTGSDFAPS